MARTFHGCKSTCSLGFYFTDRSEVVRLAFCGLEFGHWEEGDDALKAHQCWSPSCGFAKGLCVGKISIILTTSLSNHLNSLPETTTCGALLRVKIQFAARKQ